MGRGTIHAQHHVGFQNVSLGLSTSLSEQNRLESLDIEHTYSVSKTWPRTCRTKWRPSLAKCLDSMMSVP